jgi:hypothetical protein
MHAARVASGLSDEGDTLHTFRAPLSMREGSPLEYSFQDWTPSDPLPEFEDDVNGFSLVIPPGDLVLSPLSIPDLPVHIPHHSSFGEPSGVVVPLQPVVSGSMAGLANAPDLDSSSTVDVSVPVSSHTRSKNIPDQTKMIPLAMPPPLSKEKNISHEVPVTKEQNISHKAKRKPVNERWFYEEVPLVKSNSLLVQQSGTQSESLSHVQNSKTELSSPPTQARILSQRHLHPSLRINNGPLPF